MIHHGTFEDLQVAVEQCGLTGQWSDMANDAKQFRARSGEILNWWPKKGTLQFQGKNLDSFEAKMLAVLQDGSSNQRRTNHSNPKIFVVHGHDDEARDQLELVLMRLGLQAFILQNSDSEGKTIIEALEKHIQSDSDAGIVLLTPDDFGYPKSKTDADRLPRARQNVILEMGMILSALGRDRMVILKKGALEIPSDVSGIIYVEFNTHVKEVAPKIAQRMQSMGFNIDPQKIAAASQ